jgi:PAS domain-containing protein
MRTHLTPGVQRLLRRLDEFPVSVFDAIGTVLAWNDAWAALLGDPSAQRGWQRNIFWRFFTGAPSRLATTAEAADRFAAEGASNLRTAAARFPADEQVQGLVAELLRVSPRFREAWQTGTVVEKSESQKTVIHPEVGAVTVDCDIYLVQGTDLRVIAYTAEPGSEAAEKLAFTRVIGLESMR